MAKEVWLRVTFECLLRMYIELTALKIKQTNCDVLTVELPTRNTSMDSFETEGICINEGTDYKSLSAHCLLGTTREDY